MPNQLIGSLQLYPTQTLQAAHSMGHQRPLYPTQTIFEPFDWLFCTIG